jgi:lipoic acid synthetase
MIPGDRKKKPDWLKIKMPGGSDFGEVKRTLGAFKLHTVCEEARCPNLGECWGLKTATFMILGDTCTRGCRFCAVTCSAEPRYSAGSDFIDGSEPLRVKEAAESIGLRHVVITSVTRDDIVDGGASIFAETVRAVRRIQPISPTVELLIPDYVGEPLKTVLDASADVIAHNVETVERLTPLLRHPKFSFERSLLTLREAKAYRNDIFTKSSMMLGLGESDAEVEDAMAKLRDVGVDILVLGQYLRPARANIEVEQYLPLEVFERLAASAYAMGFGFVAAHPLARTSYRAVEALSALRSKCEGLSSRVL